MDVLSILNSVNKVALFLFVLVLGFVVYELSMYIKESRQVKKPSVPQFNPNSISNAFTRVVAPVKKAHTASPHKKNRLLPLLISCIILALLGGFALFYVPNTTDVNYKLRNEKPTVLDEGIALYNTEWQEIPTSKLADFKNKVVYITLKNSDGPKVDKARIKINTIDWASNQETLLFKKELNLYYIQYVIASNSARLSIQGQLHDAQNGWPE